MTLPTTKSKPKEHLSDYKILISGSPGSGKTTLASKFPDALFIATEEGHSALEIYVKTVSLWNTTEKKEEENSFIHVCKEIALGKHKFKTIVIDTIDNLFMFCSDFVCKSLKIEHESDMGFGKGFDRVNKEFARVLTRLSLLPYGLILISHTKEKEVDTRTGKIKKTVMSIRDGAEKVISKFVDFHLLIDSEPIKDENGKTVYYKRVLRTKPTQVYDAKDRTGRLPDTIDLDYDKLVEAFKNGAHCVCPEK